MWIARNEPDDKSDKGTLMLFTTVPKLVKNGYDKHYYVDDFYDEECEHLILWDNFHVEKETEEILYKILGNSECASQVKDLKWEDGPLEIDIIIHNKGKKD